ncbi:MAG TPA: TetR/AcrR family transcriptional regulator [Kofleriaceae bacterium]|nr:TetR/AcrR family transcriptional regulator [Kofleriaceae bacterium]
MARRSASKDADRPAHGAGAAGRRARPGTAVQVKGQHRAQEILQAARAVLISDGYPALTTRKVAERVGIRQSNVQYYFPAKADLVRALFEEAMAESTRALARRMAEGRMSPRQRLIWTLDQFLRQQESREEQIFLRELWALAAHDQDVAAVMNTFYRRWIDLAAANLLLVNPGLGLRRAQRRALLVVSLVDGLSLFRGEAGVDHPSVRGIESEVRAAVLALAEADL